MIRITVIIRWIWIEIKIDHRLIVDAIQSDGRTVGFDVQTGNCEVVRDSRGGDGHAGKQ